jgi:rhodanese-related sulfurtransferase
MHSLIVDVREPQEYSLSHVEGSINIPMSKLLGDVKELEGVDKDAKIILYCRTGHRSAMAIDILKAKGYSNIVNGINQDVIMAKYL